MEPVSIFSTPPVNFKIYAGLPPGRPVSDRFFAEDFCSLFNASNEKFLKGGAMDEMLKFVTPDGVSEKFFAKITQF